jgi:transposase-like protein
MNEGGKNLAMKNQRKFSLEFKRQVVEELLSGESSSAQLCRRYNIASSMLYHWKEFLKRGLQNSLNHQRRNGRPSPDGRISSAVSEGGVN